MGDGFSFSGGESHSDWLMLVSVNETLVVLEFVRQQSLLLSTGFALTATMRGVLISLFLRTGKYSDELGRADEWFGRGKMVCFPIQWNSLLLWWCYYVVINQTRMWYCTTNHFIKLIGAQVKAYPVEGGLEKAKDPLFGLAMGEASQISTDLFRFADRI